MTQSKCNRCGAPITWALAPGGKQLPFDRHPEPVATCEGYVLRPRDWDGTGPLMALDRHEALADEPTYSFHLAVCNEQRARKPR